MTKPLNFALHIMSVCAIIIHVQSVLLSVSIYNNEMECIKKHNYYEHQVENIQTERHLHVVLK